MVVHSKMCYFLDILFCTNPIVINTLKAWKLVRSMEGRTNLTSPLMSIQGNPDFPPGLTDAGFNSWRVGGIITLGDLFDGSTLPVGERLHSVA